MKIRRIFNWVTLFILAILAVNGMLFYVLYSESIKLPSEEWSRGYITDTFEATDEVVYNVIYPTVYSSDYDGRIVTAYFSGGSVHVNFLDDKLEMTSSDVFDVALEEISDFRGQIVNGNELVLFLLQRDEKALYRYTYDLEKSKLVGSESLMMPVARNVSYFEDMALIHNNEELLMWDGSQTVTLAQGMRLENIALFQWDGQWNVLTVESRMGQSRMVKRYVVLPEELKMVSEILPLASGSNYKAQELKVLVSEDHVKIFVKIYNDKFMQNYIDIVNYDPVGNEIALHYDTVNDMSRTNSTLIDTPMDQIQVTQTYQVGLGMRDISSRDESYYNLFLETYTEDEGISHKMLTRTVHLSNHPNFFTLNGYRYLQWSEVRESENLIMFASEQPELIEGSMKLMNGELWDLLWSTFSSNMLMIYFFLFIAVSIALPIVFTILPIALIFFQWAENNQDKLFSMAIGIHLLSKFYYVYNFLGDYAEVMQNLPGLLSNGFVQYGLAMSTTFVAYFCLKDYARRREIRNFLFRYLFFFIIDTILLVLILVPYRML